MRGTEGAEDLVDRVKDNWNGKSRRFEQEEIRAV